MYLGVSFYCTIIFIDNLIIKRILEITTKLLFHYFFRLKFFCYNINNMSTFGTVNPKEIHISLIPKININTIAMLIFKHFFSLK